jgi:hypothetical protein
MAHCHFRAEAVVRPALFQGGMAGAHRAGCLPRAIGCPGRGPGLLGREASRRAGLGVDANVEANAIADY